MIWIFHRERADAGSCEDYEDLFLYINLKLLEDYHGFEQNPFERPWDFTFFTPQQVAIIYDNTQQSFLTEIVKEAYNKEVGLIAICQGDFESRIEILDTPDIDREALKKQWCLAYCNAHDYIVVDNLSHPCDPAQSPWQPETKPFASYPQLPQG